MKKRIIFVISTIIIFLITLMIISLNEFGVWNPFSVLFGIIKINSTDNDYTIVQKKPNEVIFIKDYESLQEKNTTPQDIIDKYMNEMGYQKIEEDEMSGNKLYTNGNQKKSIITSSHKYVYNCIIK